MPAVFPHPEWILCRAVGRRWTVEPDSWAVSRWSLLHTAHSSSGPDHRLTTRSELCPEPPPAAPPRESPPVIKQHWVYNYSAEAGWFTFFYSQNPGCEIWEVWLNQTCFNFAAIIMLCYYSFYFGQLFQITICSVFNFPFFSLNSDVIFLMLVLSIKKVL